MAKVDDYSKANALLSDVIINYRTVIGFGQKNIKSVITRFEHLLVEPSKKHIRNAHCGGFFFGYSNCARILFLGLVFYFGSETVKKNKYETQNIYIAIMIIFSTCMGAGIAASNIPSIQKAKHSASKVFSIVDEASTLDIRDKSGKSIKEVSEGKIEFKDVTFQYPSRN